MSGEDDIGRDDDLLVAEYVLGVLPHDERVVLAQRIENDGALARRVRHWEEHLAPLGAAVEPVQPPAGVLRAVERRLFPEPDAARGFWGNLRFWRGLSVALFCALLIAAGLAFNFSRQDAQQGPGYVAQLSGSTAAVRLVALYDAGAGTLKLNRLSGAPADGRDFQLWLIQGSNPPVSLGVLPRQAMATLRLPSAVAGRLGPQDVLAVSDEPLGGSPTGLPTGAVLATGPLDAI